MQPDYSKLPPQDGGYYAQPPPQAVYGQPPPVYGQPAQGYQQQPEGGYYAEPQQHTDYSLGKDPSASLLHNTDEKFPTDKSYRDLHFMIAFYVHIAVVLVLFIVAFAKKAKSDGSNNVTDANGSYSSENGSGRLSIADEQARTIGGLVICVVLGAVFTIGWTFLLRKYSSLIVYFSFIGGIALYIIAAIIYFSTGVVFLGVVFLVMGLINALILFLARHKIEFATHVLKCVAELIDSYPATVFLAFLSIIPMMLWQMLFVATFIMCVAKFSGFMQGISLVYLIFSYYWTCQVIKNCVHVTTAGVFASWYFLSPNMPSSPTLESFKRSVTTSFGSVCLGSLIVALVKTMKALSTGSNPCACVFRIIFAIVDRLLQYFNRYAFAQVAIYGKTFCQSARATWDMFANYGFDAVINDDITGLVLNMSCVVCGLATGSLGGVFGIALFHEYSHEEKLGFFYVFAFLGFFIGFTICLLTMEVFDSGVATIFVCFVEQPERLRETSPHFYHKFQESFGSRCGTLFNV